MFRKRRTREHVIADLSYNHFEGFVYRCGWTVERTRHDYGTDLLMETYSTDGEVQNGRVMFQLKATDSLARSADGATISFRLDWRDLLYWLNELLPVILVLYDAGEETAYWLYVQEYCRRQEWTERSGSTNTVTVHIPVVNVVTTQAIRVFGQFRDECLTNLE